MIGFFPTIYEDELLYSVFSRYYLHSGYMFVEAAKNALFENKECNPSVEFINKLNADTIAVLTKYMTIEEVILNHTMFPFYGRFMNSNDKRADIKSLINMDANYERRIPKKFSGRYLKYCPICADEDRIQKGEAIWYRRHQIPGVTICSLHGCRLIDSSVKITKDTRNSLVTAEQEIGKKHIVMVKGKEKDLSVYLSKFINTDMQNNGNVAGFITSKCKIDNVDELYDNLCTFYKDLDYLSVHLSSKDAVEKVLNGNNRNSLLVGLISFYLGISAEELLGSYKGICRLERKKKAVAVNPKGRGYWKKLDDTYYERLEAVLKQFEGNNNRKPERICITAIERKLGLPKGNIRSMDRCYSYANERCESMESYYIRLAIWAVDRVLAEGKEPTWIQIYYKTYIPYKYKSSCMENIIKM